MTNIIQKTKHILDKLKSAKTLKLNIGCGNVYYKGWVNIDLDSPKADLKHDVRKPLPFADNTVDLIYNKHFLEHLTAEEAVITIKDFYRVLKPGGVLRIAMPNLKTAIRRYQNPNWKKDPLFKKYDLEYVQTRAEMLNISFRAWEHKWLHDEEELERRLKDVGCDKIKFCQHRQSQHKALRNLETRNESTLIAEVTK